MSVQYGLIGLGKMGGPIAANLVKAKLSLAVFDKAGTSSRAPAGTVIAASAADVARRADCIFLSLPDGAAVEAVLDEICGAPERRCAEIIDLSTIGIAAAHRAASRGDAAGIAYLDAPVSGGRAGAVAGSIAVMFAGSAARLAAHRPALAAMARHIFHVGDRPGQGQALKLLNNFLSAAATAATAEAVHFGLASGLALKTILDVVNVSTGRSYASEDKFVKRVLTGSFDSGFDTALMAKDMALYREAVARAGTAGGIGASIEAIWRAADAALPASDHTRIFEFLAPGVRG